MIDLYYAPTANGKRAAIILAEAQLAHRVHRVHFAAKPPELFALNPSGTVPVIVDPEGPDGQRVIISQSGAILSYIAEKAGRFWPKDASRKLVAMQWFTQALSDVAGSSAAYFAMSHDAPEKSEANMRFLEQRLFSAFQACDGQLAEREYLADEISIADFALYPFVKARWAIVERSGGLKNLERWQALVGARPGVCAAMALT